MKVGTYYLTLVCNSITKFVENLINHFALISDLLIGNHLTSVNKNTLY